MVSSKAKHEFIVRSRLANYQASLRLEGLAGSVPVATSAAEAAAKKKDLLDKYRRGA